MGKPQAHSPGEIGMICRACRRPAMYGPGGAVVHVDPGPCRPA